MPYTYEYPRPALTVDCVIFGLEESSKLKVLLIQRAHDPFMGQWALPGGFVDMEEGLEEAALRELEEETGVRDVFIEQLYTFGDTERDPRGRVVSVAYFALVNLEKHPVNADSDAKRVEWFQIDQLPRLAFDHEKILQVAIARLRAKVRYQPIGFELLPEQFTLSQLQKLYETILGVEELNKRNFRTRILKMGVLREMGKQEGVAHRPAMLYSFDKEKYEQLARDKYEDLIRRGVDFEI
ncbi:MAG: NUDIX hydrolase [Phaeodactylibacter sp.]|nr:NUDIX hydrolase [Phaeodactylibacter sp.]MCB9274824.1 NUDIX hydrolase [Lewinellaceae bacterium]